MLLPAQDQTQNQVLPSVTVTGAREDYRAPESSTATRTDSPALLTPQSIAVVPQAVLQEQSALTRTEAVCNVAGLQYGFGFNGAMQPLLILRGFAQGQRQGDSANGFQMLGDARVDAMLAHRSALVAATASLQLNVDKLFDRKYDASSHQYVQDWIKPGSPRTAKRTLQVEV